MGLIWHSNALECYCLLFSNLSQTSKVLVFPLQMLALSIYIYAAESLSNCYNEEKK